ncbi:VOC family protein, partial [Acidisoma sp. C75]
MSKMVHSMIRVLEEARSVAFYEQAFGFTIAERLRFESFTLIYMRGDAAPFELELTVNHGRTEPYALGDGYGHLALVVDDLQAAHAKIKAIGALCTDPRELALGDKTLAR